MLELRNVKAGYGPVDVLNGVSLSVPTGSCVCLIGANGAGKSTTLGTICGLVSASSGNILLEGAEINGCAVDALVRRGISLVPEDRKQSGLILEQSIVSNISLPDLMSYATFSLVSTSREQKNAEVQRKALNIKTNDVATVVGTLSGGNQQKVVLAKWLSMEPKVLIFDEPTRGVDVGAKTEIYTLMRGLADHGVAILMISSDLEEVIGVSDRMAVMHEGSIAGILQRDRFSEETIMQLAVGHSIH